jgi:hypothetical protein
MRAWGVGISAGHLVLGLIGAMVFRVPGSDTFFGLCAIVTLVLAFAAAPLLRPRRRGEGDGGLGTTLPPETPPPWWPQFERDFREYAERLTSVRGRT